MIRRILKWTGIVAGTLVVLIVIAYALISNNISGRIEKQYEFPIEYVTIPTDSATIERGRHLVAIKGCNDCHGSNLAGRTMMNDGGVGRISATNITKGKGGLPETYSDVDWVTALRHGIGRNGRPLLFMPSHETSVLSEADLAAIIAYCKQADPVDNVLPPHKVGPVARLLTFAGKMPLLSVEMINHVAPMVKTVDTSEGVALGKYLSVSCSGCHRPNMKGGDPVAPGFPPVPDITASGNPGKWTQRLFMQTLRTGKTPSGHQMKNEEMPWKMTAQYDDKELASLYKYLQSLK